MKELFWKMHLMHLEFFSSLDPGARNLPQEQLASAEMKTAPPAYFSLRWHHRYIDTVYHSDANKNELFQKFGSMLKPQNEDALAVFKNISFFDGIAVGRVFGNLHSFYPIII